MLYFLFCSCSFYFSSVYAEDCSTSHCPISDYEAELKGISNKIQSLEQSKHFDEIQRLEYEQKRLFFRLEELRKRSKLKFVLETEKQIYAVGEDIPIGITWKNVSNEAVELGDSRRLQVLFLDIKDEYGKILGEVQEGWSRGPGEANESEIVTLQPQESYKFGKNINQYHIVNFEKGEYRNIYPPGKYFITYSGGERLGTDDCCYAEPINTIMIEVIK